jgi:hypothetical protein
VPAPRRSRVTVAAARLQSAAGAVSACAVFLVLAWSLLHSGGGDPPDWSVSLVIIGAASLAVSALPSRRAPRSGLQTVQAWCAVLLPAYVAFQLVPLPVGLLRIIDPTRAELADALYAVASGVSTAPLTVAPPRTWVHASRVLGYALVFLLARHASDR